MINWLYQLIAVAGFSLRTIPERKGASLAAVFGIAGVVAVLVGVLSIAQGFRRAMVASGSPETVLVLRRGADAEMMSGLQQEEVRLIGNAPGLLRGVAGPAASAELFVVINLPKRTTGTDANVPLRGVELSAFVVRPEVQLIAGRRFEPGRNELLVGRAAAREFAGLDLNATLRIGSADWTVVGIFADGGGIAESEIWTDSRMLQSAYRRGETYQSVYARLESEDAFMTFKDALTADPRLQVDVIRQVDYYAKQSEVLYKLVTGFGTLISVLMGFGALFGALNTMYNAVAVRSREIATLRALGFQTVPVVVSVLAESLALALVGGILGGLGAYLAFNGFEAATLNYQSFSQVAFSFAVTPILLIEGILYSAVIGLLGGLFPAIRAARQPIAMALREL
ncbi:MAG: ABC transporter permease [Verrucomicrobiales bacterium]|nr:ABC transporter permease [Verrucomicrobiales bacterium]